MPTTSPLSRVERLAGLDRAIVQRKIATRAPSVQTPWSAAYVEARDACLPVSPWAPRAFALAFGGLLA